MRDRATSHMASSALGRSSSWKDRLTRKFIGDRDKDREKTLPNDAKEEEWCFIDVNNSEMEVNSVDGPKRKTSKGHLASPVVGIGARSSSVGSRVSRSENKLQRPASPQGSPQGSPQSKLKRTPSGRVKKLEVHGQPNGRASPGLRSASPNRGSARKKGGIMVPPRTSSPSEPPKDQVKETPKVNPKDAAVKNPEFSFAKVRDTLRIHRPKKRKGVKNVPYSAQYSAPEINLSPPSKYQDPFEASANFMDSTEVPKMGQGHDFKAVSIPHNKPGYCDHCGDTAWGLYRQVLKCSSECVHVCMHSCAHVCVCVCTCVCVSVRVCVHVCMHVCEGMCVCGECVWMYATGLYMTTCRKESGLRLMCKLPVLWCVYMCVWCVVCMHVLRKCVHVSIHVIMKETEMEST